MRATRRAALAVAFAAAALGVIALGVSRETRPRAGARAGARAGSSLPRCRFEPGETAAFKLESTARDVRGEEEDHLRATLSWEVVAPLAADRWRLRAALTEVSHSQALTLPEERVRGSLAEPFFVDVDASCRFVGFGFVRDWDARRRQLVQSTLLTHEFVLPAAGKQRWTSSQSDGLGPFEAGYAVVSGGRDGSLRVQRHKRAYDGQARAAGFGLSVAVIGAEATASFEREAPRWLASSSGLERVQILIQGEVQADLLQQFSLARDDSGFVAVPALNPDEADFRDAFDLEVERDHVVDAELAEVSHDEAMRRFFAHFGGGLGDPSYAAARELAAWLRAHPEETGRLLAALRAGAIAEAARPALFLALELAGTEAARDVLAEALVDPRLDPVDRARAASALSDIGAPTQGTAELLLAQAQRDRDEVVANVSLLGLGGMARRGDDELKTYVRSSLERELASAGDEGRTRVVLDAMGNSGDPAFADTLATHLEADSASTRQHAAEALGRLDPSASGPRLLDRLAHETDPVVGAAIVAAYRGPATADAIAQMSDRLASSASVAERAAIIKWLGGASRTEPEARSRLVAHVGQETNARLMQQIGAYLPAAALR